MRKKYPFDPSIQHHLLIALGLSIWIFVFLYFTEPLDVGQLTPQEKLQFLPFYGLFGALGYLLCLPVQLWLFRREGKWMIWSELVFFGALVLLGLGASWMVYYYLVMKANPYSYTLDYFFVAIYLPAGLTLFPILAMGCWSFGKYKEKRLETNKVEIQGIGTHEGIRLPLESLIMVRSSDNYVEIYFLEGLRLKTQLIRNTLATVAVQVPDLCRTHRSFLINPIHFKQWKSGNRKLLVQLSEGLEAPVSKTYQPQVKLAVDFTTE
ncbi:LytTR family DNA-binding domain-containing protein [Algoriphagus namhaensis]